ncbi:MAG TPA: glycosyltransferase family 2 protein, partial [Alphaproteobacteria bacterium]|nr:glycosyltransferase family 2 protein [Alphaproteobacteria bacterium]
MITTNPLFSVISVTLNYKGGLKRTHESLKNQDYDNYEWIVIDGGSNDGTAEYLKSVQASHISEKDSGIYDAMNKGIERSNGHYLIFMNAGDCFTDTNILSALKEIIEQENSDFIYGDALENTDGKIVTKKARHHSKITQGMFTHHQAMVYSRALIGDARYSLSYKIAADYDLTLRLLKKVKKISYLPQAICLFESGGVSQRQVLK